MTLLNGLRQGANSINSARVPRAILASIVGRKGSWGVVGLAGCCFLLVLGSVGFGSGSQPSDFSGGPALIMEVFTPCPGYCDLYPSTNGSYLGSTPDFSQVKLYPVTVGGVSTWNILVLSPPGTTTCRPAMKFTLSTPGTLPDGDYCAVAGCGVGTAVVWVP